MKNLKDKFTKLILNIQKYLYAIFNSIVMELRRCNTKGKYSFKLEILVQTTN